MYRTLERESGCYERDGERTDIQHRGDRERYVKRFSGKERVRISKLVELMGNYRKESYHQ